MAITLIPQQKDMAHEDGSAHICLIIAVPKSHRALTCLEGQGKICDVLRILVPFIQFKKRGKRPWRSATFSKVAGF